MLLILDEVMCGMGRTGTLHACEQEGIAPDLMTIAKGLGGGYQPIGAVLLGEHIFDAFASGSGFFQHGHTYIGHPLACAAALAVQEVIRRDDLLANVRRMGALLRAAAAASASATIHMSATFAAAACSRRSSWWRTARPRRRSIRQRSSTRRVKKAAMARGLMVYPMGGTIDGVRGDHVLLAPPFIVDGRPDRRDRRPSGERHRRRPRLRRKLRAGGNNEPATSMAPCGRERRRLLAAASPATAQPYPSRPVTMIVPASAGGPTDAIARVLSERMTANLGGTVLVDNVAGAGGSIGVGKVARATPDGYTLGIGQWSHYVLNGATYALQYDLLADFAPVAMIVTGPLLLVSRKDLPANDLKALIAWLKANPDKATAGTGGVGSPRHISGIFFQKMTGTQLPVRALSRHGAGDARSSGRPDRHHDRPGLQRAAAAARRHDQGLCGHRQGAPAVGARGADRR